MKFYFFCACNDVPVVFDCSKRNCLGILVEGYVPLACGKKVSFNVFAVNPYGSFLSVCVNEYFDVCVGFAVANVGYVNRRVLRAGVFFIGSNLSTVFFSYKVFFGDVDYGRPDAVLIGHCNLVRTEAEAVQIAPNFHIVRNPEFVDFFNKFVRNFVLVRMLCRCGIGFKSELVNTVHTFV